MEEIKKSRIRTAHEESYSDGKILGVLLNYNPEREMERIDSFIFYFRMTDQGGMYVFFETLVAMYDHMLYGDKKVKRAYMKEDDFDNLYDNDINGVFNTFLNWDR